MLLANAIKIKNILNVEFTPSVMANFNGYKRADVLHQTPVLV